MSSHMKSAKKPAPAKPKTAPKAERAMPAAKPEKAAPMFVREIFAAERGRGVPKVKPAASKKKG